MGDELQRTQQARLTETDDSSTNPTTNIDIQHVSSQSGMEFESFQQHFPIGGYPGATTIDMRSMANALPDYQMRPLQQQPFQHQMPQPLASPSTMYPYHQGAQFAGQTANNFNPNFVPQYPQQYIQSQQLRQHQSQSFPQFIGGHSGLSGPHGFQTPGFSIQPGMIPTSQAPAQSQAQQYFLSPSTHYNIHGGVRTGSGYQVPQVRVETNQASSQGTPFYQQLHPNLMRRTSSNSSLQGSVIRGPPRKPKQSGHALWVGNLPPGTHIVDLKDHFSRDATEDIESVFLISKSNCAFVNYKTETSCTAAMARFHDSRFQGVRLVCRLRRGSAPTTGSGPNVSENKSSAVSGEVVQTEDEETAQESVVVMEELEGASEAVEKVKEKFFIVKSLTIEDLERSVHSGVWATQAHNEVALNKAYQSAESVYLVFSANKSGEYFGYARMDSAIDDEAAAAIEYPSRREAGEPSPSDLPLAIPTLASTTAPKGRIIDDSARGTIFWEAEQTEKEQGSMEEDPGNISGEGNESGVSATASPATPSPATPQTFGKPFKIVWMSTERLPFYRTRGLRNPWNANREVKIARDGTEIEPSVGRRLVTMFHKPQAASASPANNRQSGMTQMPGMYMPSQGQMQGGMYGRPY